MTILEEVPAELAALAANLNAAPVLAGFTLARGTLQIEVTLSAPGRLRIRVDRPDLLVAPRKTDRGQKQAPYRSAELPPPLPVIEEWSPVKLGLDADAPEAADRLSVATRLEHDALSHLLTAEVRRRAASLLEDGYSSVVLLRQGPTVEAEREIEEGLPADGEMIRTGIYQLAELASAIPTIATRETFRRGQARDWSALWWSIPPILLASMIAEYASWSFLNPFANFAGLLVGLGIALTLGPIMAIAQMRRGRTTRASLLAFVWLTLFTPLALQSGLMFLNCALDTSPIKLWHAQVDKLNVRKEKNNEYYEAVLKRRAPKQLPVKLSINDDLYNALRARSESERVVILDLRRGVLELEWFTRVELEP